MKYCFSSSVKVKQRVESPFVFHCVYFNVYTFKFENKLANLSENQQLEAIRMFMLAQKRETSLHFKMHQCQK